MNKTQLLALEQLSHLTSRQLQAANPELYMKISTLAEPGAASSARVQELMDVPLKDNPLVQGELQQARMHRLGDLCELSQRKVKAVLARGLTVDTLDDESLKSLVAEKRLKDNDARQLGLAAGLFRLFDGDLDLTRAVMKKRLPDFGNHRAKQLRQLVTLDAAEWQRVLRKDKIAPPENTSLEEYAEIISRKVAALYPTDSYFVRLAPVRADELSGQIKRVAPLFEQAAAVFNKPGFESLTSENVELLDLEVFRKGYEQLLKSMDKIPGLTGLRLTGDRVKSAPGNATPKVITSVLVRSMFERFETGRFKPKTLVRMHDTYVQLKRTANRYHGLGLAKLLDDPQLTPDQKAEQVATKVGWVEQVRAQNPNVELLKLDYAPGSADIAALDFDGLDESQQSMTLAALRANQRVYALTRDVDHARAILEAGYISGTSIACAGYAAFAESTGLPAHAARRYYDAARDMTVTVGAGLGAAMDSIWGGFRWLNVCNTGENRMESGAVKLDDYESLFGSQTFCNCKHCQSILSPAAYFVDLMRFLGSNIPYSGMLLLNSRRPDLWTVELTCENTNTEIPTLDIVNEILKNFLGQMHTGTPAQQERDVLILQMLGNFRRPFWPAFEKLAGCLAHFDLTRAAIARELEAAPATLAKAMLGIVTPEEYVLIAHELAGMLRLSVQSGFYGIDFSIDASTNKITPIDVQEFLKPLGIGRPGLDELVKTHFVSGGIRIVPWKRTSESVQFDIEVVENLTLEVLNRIQRFTRLWHHLPAMNGGTEGSCWTILELDLILRLLGSSQTPSWNIDLENLARVLALQERFGLSLMETCGLWCSNLQEVRLSCQPACTSLFERLFNPSALAQAGTPFPRLSESFVHPAFLKPGETTSEDALHRLHAGLKVNDEELYQLIIHLEQPLGLDLAVGKYGFLLSVENLSLLYRHARLSKLLGLTIPEFFQPAELPAQGVLTLADLSALTALLDFHDWRRASGYKLDEVGFIIGGKVLSPNVYPDPHALAGEIQAKVQTDKALEFADTLFAFLDGATEAQSRLIIAENPTIIEAVNAEKTVFRLADEIDPDVRLTIPDDVIKAVVKAKGISDAEAQAWLEEESWAGLIKYHSSRIIPAYLATLMNVPVEKMDRLVAMTGMDLFDGKFTLILRDDSAPATLLAQLVDKILRLNVLFGKQVFDPAALDFIYGHQGIFSITDLAKIDVAKIRKLSVYLSLAGVGTVESSDISGLLLDLDTWLADPSKVTLDSLAHELSNVLQIEMGLAVSLLNSIPLPQSTPEAVLKLARCAKLVRQLGVGVSVLPDIISDDYNELSAASEAVLAAYKAGYQDEAEWQKQITLLEDRLRSGTRDVLCHALSQIWRTQKGEVLTRNDLYDLLLIDVELEGCARTSKVVAAISSVQLYIQRILMNLETVQPNDSEMAKEWEWRKNYRVWEANRKVFLYPENYIEPDLRDDKTPLFEELESKLLQQQITPQNVLDAYGAYLSDFEEVARLKIAGSYHDKGNNTDTLHLFGVTPDTPPVYYYRAVRNAYFGETEPTTHGIDWSHWRKVSVQIPVRKVSPVVYNGRLYVFWVEMTTLAKNDLSNGASRFVGYNHKLSLKYTNLRLDGTWTAPQKISLADDHVFPLGDGIVDDPLLTSEEKAILRNLEIALQVAACTNPPGDISGITYDIVAFQTTKMVTPQYDPYRQHFEPKDGYTLTGFQWDQVYPDASSQYLNVTLANFMMFGELDFYRKAINSRRMIGSSNWEAPSRFQILSTYSEPIPPSGLQNRYWLSYCNGITSWPYYSQYGSCSAYLNIGKQFGSDRGFIGTPNYTKIAQMNVPGEFALINGFSFRDASDNGVSSLQDCTIDLEGDIFLLQGSVTTPPYCRIQRIGTTLSEKIVRTLFANGVAGLLDISTQLGLREEGLPLTPTTYASIDDVTNQNISGQCFDFKHGPYGIYYREIFFHTPFLIANHLNSQGRFADAQRWYHYIFNPTSGDVTDPPRDHNWRYLEFRNLIPSLRSILTDPETIEVYKKDPFNPHAIARLRTSAYQKSIVMKYIDNLLDWADSLFSQFTRESVNDATMLYVIAAEILGERPAELGECGEGGLKPKNLFTIASQSHLYPESEFLLEYPAALETRVLQRSFPAAEKTIQDYQYLPGKAELVTAGRSVFDYQGNGTESKKLFSAYDWRKISQAGENHLSGGKQSPLIHDPALIADFSASLIQSVCAYSGDLSQLDPSHNGPAQFEIRPIFCVPANNELLGYWNRVEDRLYKIRHCLDINGVRRDLALFAPEIDPRLLVRMKASGLTLEDVLGATSGNLPPYRFAYLIEKARQYAGTVQGFGSALLSALEKKDVEELNLLRAVHEQNILKLTRQIRQWEIDVEAETIRALRERREAIQYRKSYYVGLKDAGLIEWETTQQVSQHAVTVARVSEVALAIVASILHLVPEVGSPFAMKYGGFQSGNAFVNLSTAAEATADVASAMALSAGLEATFQRRGQEWKHQIELADRELKEIERQLAAAEIRQEIVNKSLEIHEKNIEQAREVYDFYGDKFSSFGLYTWLSTELRTLYRDAYQSALAMARLAERAYRFERDDDTSLLLDANYWDASHAGLLAGEQLSIALQNMERKFIETNYRTFEIDQSISLAQISPLALVQLRETGECDFSIPEWIFDLYYPGQYRRIIKAVRLTVPSVVGPYTNVGATLRLTRGQVRVEPKIDPNVLKDVPLQRSVCIATSRAQNDAGVFELNFHDERYMPFEGAGAVSDWKLELPSILHPFDYDTISDVILHISYTAKDGGIFKQDVEADLVTRLKQGNLCRLFSLRHEFPTEWAKFKSQMPASNERFELAVNLHPEHYPFWSQGSLLNEVAKVELLAQNASSTSSSTMDVFGSKEKLVTELIGTLSKNSTLFGDLLHGSLFAAGMPERPDQELKLFFNTNAMTDLWVAVTWK